MADTPYLPSVANDLGTSLDSIYLLNSDTRQRWDNVYGDMQQPMKYTIPDYTPDYKGLTQPELMSPGTNKDAIKAALFSDDPRERDLATSVFNNQFQKDPVNKGVGTTEVFPYSKEMNKYLNSDFGYNPYQSIEDNEAFNYQNDYMQKSLPGRILANVGKGVSRFVLGVGAKAVQTFGYMGGLIWNGVQELYELGNNAVGGSFHNNAMADIADNTLARMATNWEQDMKDSNALQVFKPRGWNDMGFFQKLGHGAMWSDEVSDGAAFMGEMVLSSYLLGAGLGKIGGLAKFGETGINMASKLGKVGRVMDFGVKALTGAEDISGIGRWAFLTTSESAMEASNLFDSRKLDLQNRRQKGELGYADMSDEEINRRAGNAAAVSFRTNLAILSISNAFENKMIFNPLLKRTGREADHAFAGMIGMDESIANTNVLARAFRKTYDYATKVGKYLNWKDVNGRLGFYGKRAGEALLMEGFWEENAQLAIERLAANDHYVNSSVGNQVLGFLNQTGTQAVDTVKGYLPGGKTTDPEAESNIGLGMLIGIAGTVGTSKIAGATDENGKVRWGVGERRQKEANARQAIETYEKFRKNFLSFQDIYDKDEEGNLVVNQQKAVAIMQALGEKMDAQGMADKVTDPILKTHLQNNFAADYVFASKQAGLYDRMLDRFKNLGKQPADMVKDLGFDPNTTITPSSFVATLEEYGKLYDAAMDDRNKSLTDPKEMDEDWKRVNALYSQSTTAHSARSLANEYLIDSLNMPSNFSVQDASSEERASDVQEYNSLSLQSQVLDQIEGESKEHGNYYADFIKTERARINAKMKELNVGIQDRVSKGELALSRNKLYYAPSRFVGVRERHRDAAESIIATSLNEDHKNIGKNAELTIAANQAEMLARKFKGSQGMENYRDYIKYRDSVAAKDRAADDNEHTVEKNAEGKFDVIDPEGKVVGTYDKADEAQQVADEFTATEKPEVTTVDNTTPNPPAPEELPDSSKTATATATPAPTVTVTPTPTATDSDLAPETDETLKDNNVVTDTKLVEAKSGEQEVAITKEVSWFLPTISSKSDTVDIDGKTEQFSNNTYDTMRSEFIRSFMPTAMESGNYQLFMVKDNFPSIYAGKNFVSQKEDGSWKFNDDVTPGEVIVLQDLAGNPVTVSTFFGNKYKDVADQPIVFSFDKGFEDGMWIAEPMYSERLKTYAKRMEVTIAEARKEYEKEIRLSNQARDFLRANPTDKINLIFVDSTSGINPRTHNKYEPVVDRFGEDFKFDVATPLARGGDKTQFPGFPKGMVVATINKFNFAVLTQKLADQTDVLNNVIKTLNYRFDTVDDAKGVRDNYLNTIINANQFQFFTIDKDGDKFKINFRKRESISIPRNSATIANESIGAVRLNVSRKALKDGYATFNPENGEMDFVEKEDYAAFIKPKLVTSLKKVLDKNGKITMEPVNPYFSFSIQDDRLEDVDLKQAKIDNQKVHFDRLKARINTLISTNALDPVKVRSSLDESLRKEGINADQHAELVKMIEVKPKLTPEEEKQNKIKSLLDRRKTLSNFLAGTDSHAATVQGEKDLKAIEEELKKLGYVEPKQVVPSVTPSVVPSNDPIIDIENRRKKELEEARMVMTESEMESLPQRENAINAKYDAELTALQDRETPEPVNTQAEAAAIDVAFPKIEDYVIPMPEGMSWNTQMKKGYKEYYMAYGANSDQLVKVAGIPLDPVQGFNFFMVQTGKAYLIVNEETGMTLGDAYSSQKEARDGYKKYLEGKNIAEAMQRNKSVLKQFNRATPAPITIPEAKVENPEANKEKAKSVIDKYKNVEKKDISKEMNSANNDGPKPYFIKSGSTTFYYNPENNTVYTMQDGEMEEFTMSGGPYLRVMNEFLAKHPYSEAGGVNSGFNYLTVEDPGGKYTVIEPPTIRPNSEIIINERGIKVDKNELLKSLTPENREKIQEFIKRFC